MVIMQDHVLSQAQLDAIVPVINRRMNERMGKAKFEAACVEAMAQAGCPLPTSKVDEATPATK